MQAVTSRRADCRAHSSSLIISCASSSRDGLPSVSFTLASSRTYTLTADDYMHDRTIGIMPLRSSSPSSSRDVSLIILGDTFLHTFYTAFDMDEQSIAIANGKNVRREETAASWPWTWQLLLSLLLLALLLCVIGACCCVLWGRGAGADAAPAAPLFSSAAPGSSAQMPTSTV